MIDLVKQTPQVYSKKSRDYQVISRLYSAIFNVSKMYADGMHIWERDIDNKLATLRAKTLNLNTKYSWSLDDLETLTSYFKHLIKIKGTKQVMIECLNLILKSEKYDATVSEKDIELNELGELTIILRHKLSSLDIVDDLVRLFMPAGLTYRIIYKDSPTMTGKHSTDVFITDTFTKLHEWDITDSSYKQIFIGDNVTPPTENQFITNTYVYDNNLDIKEEETE